MARTLERRRIHCNLTEGDLYIDNIKADAEDDAIFEVAKAMALLCREATESLGIEEKFMLSI